MIFRHLDAVPSLLISIPGSPTAPAIDPTGWTNFPIGAASTLSYNWACTTESKVLLRWLISAIKSFFLFFGLLSAR